MTTRAPELAPSVIIDSPVETVADRRANLRDDRPIP